MWTYCLRNIQPNNALECPQLQHNSMLLQPRLVLVVEPQTARNRHARYDEVNHRDPDVCEVRAVALLAVPAEGERSGACDPDKDAGGNELQDAVPDELHIMLVGLSTDRHQESSLSALPGCAHARHWTMLVCRTRPRTRHDPKARDHT